MTQRKSEALRASRAKERAKIEESSQPSIQARELYAAAGAERGLAECHERLDERLEALAAPPREGHRR